MILSPKINKIHNGLADGNSSIFEESRAELQDGASPIIEDMNDDNEHALVTFVYRAKHAVDNVVITGSFPSYRVRENMIERLLETDLWYKSFKCKSNVKFSYNLSVNDLLDDYFQTRVNNLILDEYNPKSVLFPADSEDSESKVDIRSLTVMQHVKDDYWSVPSPDCDKGTLGLHRIKSDILSNTRRVWVYKPYKYDEAGVENDLILLADGFYHVMNLHTVDILDKLIEERAIPKSVCVYIDSVENRAEELGMNEDYAKFIVTEILSWVYKKLRVSRNPDKMVLGGLSLGGIATAHIALAFPGVFGYILAQTGSFWWRDEALINEY